MPAVPKPSQVSKVSKRPKAKKAKLHLVKGKKAKKAKATKKSKGKKRDSHALPIKGKSFEWLEEIKKAGGTTRKALIDGCAKHGLGPTMHNAMAAWCRELDLLKEK